MSNSQPQFTLDPKYNPRARETPNYQGSYSSGGGPSWPGSGRPSPNNRVLVITTGGTIDGVYSPEQGMRPQLPANPQDSGISKALQRLGYRVGASGNVDVLNFSMKFSDELSQVDMNRLIDAIIRGGYSKVVITTGTDSMSINGSYLDSMLSRVGLQNTRVVITGAWSPLRNQTGAWREKSDGWKNLKRAMEEVNTVVRPGVYVEMGEGLWNPHKIIKQKITQIVNGFEETI